MSKASFYRMECRGLADFGFSRLALGVAFKVTDGDSHGR